MKTVEAGWRIISNPIYHSIPGLSRSFLHKLVEWSGAHAKVPTEETEAMRLGTNFHSYVLEPEKAEKEFVTYPADCLVGSGKGQQGRKADFDDKATAKGQTILKPADLETIKCMAGAVHADPDAQKYLTDGQAEISGFWKDPDDPNILCKIRPDWLRNDGIIGDLKKTKDARKHAFRAQAYSLGYDMEAAWYLHGASQITGKYHGEFYFIACEAVEPYGVIVYRASEKMIACGTDRWERARSIYLECLQDDIWPAYEEGIVDLDPPDWVLRRMEKEVPHE